MKWAGSSLSSYFHLHENFYMKGLMKIIILTSRRKNGIIVGLFVRGSFCRHVRSFHVDTWNIFFDSFFLALRLKFLEGCLGPVCGQLCGGPDWGCDIWAARHQGEDGHQVGWSLVIVLLLHVPYTLTAGSADPCLWLMAGSGSSIFVIDLKMPAIN